MEFPEKDYKDKEVLITGGCGFIGSNIAHELLKQGAKITIFDLMEPDFHNNELYDNLANIEDIKDKVKLIKGDIRDINLLKEEVKNKDIIFHCAAHTSHPQSLKNPFLNLDINCKGTLNLLESARMYNDKVKIVYCGSSTQIGQKVSDVIDEKHPEFPRDIYSANKMAAEKYNLIYHYVYGMNTTILRLANNYGPRAFIHSPNFGFINYFIGLALQNKDITIYGEGEQKRTVTFVDDTVNALLKAGVSKECVGNTMFIAREKDYSIKEIAENVIKVMKSGNIKFIPWPAERKAIEIGDTKIDTRKGKELLKWNPIWGLEAGLEKTKDYYIPKIKKYLKNA